MPALAFFRPSLLGRLYSVEQRTSLFLLLHHRAALFVIILILCIWAIAVPDVRRLASLCVGVSMMSFLILYWQAGSPPTLKTIAFVDAIALPALAFATWSAFNHS